MQAMSAIKEHVAGIGETNSSKSKKDRTSIAAIKEQETDGAKSQAGEHKEDEKQGLKITMKHFERALQKIKKKTTNSNQSLSN